MPAVQLQITTLDNPIHINPNAIAHALSKIDIVVVGADVQWANAQEWADLMNPAIAGGWHSKDRLRLSDTWVEYFHGRWLRHYEDPSRESEEIF